MKKLICLLAVLFLSIFLITISYIQQSLNECAEKNTKKKNEKTVEYIKPDLEYLDEYGLDSFETSLPVLYIDTKHQRLSKENPVWASIAVLDSNVDGSENSIESLPDYSSPITIKYRGASSYSGFDKAQYRIKFYKKADTDKEVNYNFLGMGSNSEWVLNGPFLDKTLIRNRMIYGLGKEIFEWAPDCRYTEVFVNGKYQGVYLAIEPVTNGESRLRLCEFGLLSGQTSYIVKRDRSNTEGDPLQIYGKLKGKTNNDLYIDYPSQKKLTSQQRDWITQDISEFEEVLYSDKFADSKIGYAKYIDVDCFVDYYIFNEIMMNSDAGNLSTYIYKELGGKLQITIWDYNDAFNNYQWFRHDFTEFYLQNNAWFSRLVRDRAFVEKVEKRYKELRKGLFNTGTMYATIDGCIEELGPAIDRNFAIWGYTFHQNLLTSGNRDLEDYDSAIVQLKEAIGMRTEFLDAHITDLFDNCVN